LKHTQAGTHSFIQIEIAIGIEIENNIPPCLVTPYLVFGSAVKKVFFLLLLFDFFGQSGCFSGSPGQAGR
jgi:hypothetical protein